MTALTKPVRSPKISNRCLERSSSTSSSSTLVDSNRSHIFTSSHSSDPEDGTPTILVFPSSCRSNSIENGESSQESVCKYQSSKLLGETHVGLHITSLAVERGECAGGSVRIFVGYSNADASLLCFDTVKRSFHQERFIADRSSEPIVSAVLHSSLLVTCTANFRIRIYRVKGTSAQLLEERRTYSCHWPATLRLEPLSGLDGDSYFRLSIAYSSPVYPIGWTVGLQEIIIGLHSSLSSRSASARQAHVVTRIDSPSKDDRKWKALSRHNTKEDRRKQVGRLTSLSYEDPFIVVGTEDNEVICFKVAGTTQTVDAASALSPSPLSLSLVCTFQGHTGSVHSVSLNEGRCVTGGGDGSVRVWKLGDEEESVANAAGLLTTMDASLRKGLGKVVTIGSSLSLGKRKRRLDEREETNSSAPLTLAEILREAQTASNELGRGVSSSAVVRWVASAFDQIISISAIKRHSPIPGSCRSEIGACFEKEEEQVQIWNFSH
ncbi:hypothetical protein CBS101457_006734 [Exobasidium rhododendri]|nr:hypothetical protein CBS101457_006734 [Exobasidium rhododendri]